MAETIVGIQIELTTSRFGYSINCRWSSSLERILQQAQYRLGGRIACPGRTGQGDHRFQGFLCSVGLDMAEEHRLLDQRSAYETHHPQISGTVLISDKNRSSEVNIFISLQVFKLTIQFAMAC